MLPNHLILYHLLLILPSIFPSIRVFSSESVLCLRWSKYCSFSCSISAAQWGQTKQNTEFLEKERFICKVPRRMGSSWLKDSNSLMARIFKDSGGGGVQSLSHLWLLATPRTAVHQASLSFTISQSLRKLMPIELVMLPNHLILYHLLLILPSIFPSIRVFSNESTVCIRWPEYWRFSFRISPFNEYSGLIFFRIDWFDLLEVQEILKSLTAPQFKSINSSVLSLHYGPTLISVLDYWKNHIKISWYTL